MEYKATGVKRNRNDETKGVSPAQKQIKVSYDASLLFNKLKTFTKWVQLHLPTLKTLQDLAGIMSSPTTIHIQIDGNKLPELIEVLSKKKLLRLENLLELITHSSNAEDIHFHRI